MKSYYQVSCLLTTTCILLFGCGSSSDGDHHISATTSSVGKKIFFDESLSSQNNQSCGSCHDPNNGFSDPRVSNANPVSEGSESGAFGTRNAPTAAYASFIPLFDAVSSTTADGTASQFQGGQFLDGRATDLVTQAKAPFLNPVEMNNTDKAEGVAKLQNAHYANEFMDVFGANVFDDIETAYNNMTLAIAAFEASSEMSPFSSKFDAVMAGTESFSAAELNGFDLFKNKAKCANCHTVNDPPERSLFTDFNFFHVGTPVNTNNPAFIANDSFRDQGLADNLHITNPTDRDAQRGKFRTPTLRNVALTAPYMHNGRYQSLQEVINHYDVIVSSAEAGFTPMGNYPEIDENIANELNFGDPNFAPALGLSPQETNDLEAFLLTLTDGYL